MNYLDTYIGYYNHRETFLYAITDNRYYYYQLLCYFQVSRCF